MASNSRTKECVLLSGDALQEAVESTGMGNGGPTVTDQSPKKTSGNSGPGPLVFGTIS